MEETHVLLYERKETDMPKKTYTVSTRLQKNSPLVCYMEEYMTEYNQIYRYAWQVYTSKAYAFATDSKFRTHLCEKFGILGRTANSIIRDMKGTIEAYLELKKTELQQLEQKIERKEEEIKGLKVVINELKPKIANNTSTEKQLEKYRTAKQSLYFQQNKLNKWKQQRKKVTYQIENRKISLGFGSKMFFRKQYFLQENGYGSHRGWYHVYVKERDKNVYYLGSNNEKQGNQMFQMTYVEDTNDFRIQVRKDFGHEKEEKYVMDTVDFAYQKEVLKQICMAYENKERPHALSYRIHREKKKWYLQVQFTLEYTDYETRTTNGVFGLDYNDGFIEVSETDENGNLIGQYHYDLRYHGTGKKAKTEIEQVVSQIVNVGKRKGKSIVIEDLNFKNTKAKQTKGKTKKGKAYNRMLHKFDYSRYKRTLENCSHRKNVELIEVNPKNTSKIGKQKYSERMKLSVHQAASYVIARKGQGYSDRLVS